MAAMPLLNRQPEAPYIQGLLVIVVMILLATALRYHTFFLHEIFDLR
jgi:hypothetical protein